MPKALRQAYESGRLPDPEVLREHFHYEPDTGALIRKKGANVVAGQPVRTARRVHFEYGAFSTARFIWALVTGAWPRPEQYICFKDGDPTNLTWDNLLLADRATAVCFPNEPAVRYPKRKYAQPNQFSA